MKYIDGITDLLIEYIEEDIYTPETQEESIDDLLDDIEIELITLQIEREQNNDKITQYGKSRKNVGSDRQ